MPVHAWDMQGARCSAVNVATVANRMRDVLFFMMFGYYCTLAIYKKVRISLNLFRKIGMTEFLAARRGLSMRVERYWRREWGVKDSGGRGKVFVKRVKMPIFANCRNIGISE